MNGVTCTPLITIAVSDEISRLGGKVTIIDALYGIGLKVVNPTLISVSSPSSALVCSIESTVIGPAI